MRRRRYSPEEKERAVREVIDSPRLAAAVARDRGISPSALRRWVRALLCQHDPDPKTSTAEVARAAG